ncbi:MAG: hypothetical protein KA715_09725 [Xanthomonadaceae bacterium]|nr:hypothetical protein [Xanthomonadaceae bacterium]
MLFSNLALSADAYEIVSLKFKDDVKVDEQKKLMADLNRIIQKFEGFKSRDYFYSPENERWIDFVVWSDVKLAKKASGEVMNDPIAGAVFSKIDEKTIFFTL